jgi:hypothetical protein
LINSSARLRNKEKAVIAHYFREPDVFSGLRGVIPRGGEDKLGAGIIQAPTLVGVQDQVPITITEDGVLVEIIDKDKQAFFELSSATIKPAMRKVLELIVKETKDAPKGFIGEPALTLRIVATIENDGQHHCGYFRLFICINCTYAIVAAALFRKECASNLYNRKRKPTKDNAKAKKLSFFT